MKGLIIVLCGIFVLNLNAQTTDYEQFKGKSINVSVIAAMSRLSFKSYNITDRKSCIEWYDGALKQPPTAPKSTRDLLYLLHTAKNKKALRKLVTHPSLIEQYEIKRKKDFTKNHFQPIHQLCLRKKDISFCILKYAEIKNGKQIAIKSMQKASLKRKDGHHKLITSEDDLLDIEYMIRHLSSEAMKQVLGGEDISNPAIVELRESCSRGTPYNSKININQLASSVRRIEQEDAALWEVLTTME